MRESHAILTGRMLSIFNQSAMGYSNTPLGVYAHAQLLIFATPPHLLDYQFYRYTHYIHSKTMYATAMECLCMYEMSVEKIDILYIHWHLLPSCPPLLRH